MAKKKRKKKVSKKTLHWAKFRFEVVRDPNGGNKKYYWRAIGCNGRLICESETYLAERGPIKTIKNLVKAIKAGQFKIVEGMLTEPSDLP